MNLENQNGIQEENRLALSVKSDSEAANAVPKPFDLLIQNIQQQFHTLGGDIFDRLMENLTPLVTQGVEASVVDKLASDDFSQKLNTMVKLLVDSAVHDKIQAVLAAAVKAEVDRQLKTDFNRQAIENISKQVIDQVVAGVRAAARPAPVLPAAEPKSDWQPTWGSSIPISRPGTADPFARLGATRKESIGVGGGIERPGSALGRKESTGGGAIERPGSALGRKEKTSHIIAAPGIGGLARPRSAVGNTTRETTGGIKKKTSSVVVGGARRETTSGYELRTTISRPATSMGMREQMTPREKMSISRPASRAGTGAREVQLSTRAKEALKELQPGVAGTAPRM